MQPFGTRDLMITVFSDDAEMCNQCTNPGTGCLQSEEKPKEHATERDLAALREQLSAFVA